MHASADLWRTPIRATTSPASDTSLQPLKPPPPIDGRIFLKEVAGIGQLARTCLRWRRLVRTLPRGRRTPVLLIPGFLTGDGGMAPMRTFLSALGYSVNGWGLGINRGNVERTLPLLIARAEALAAQAGQTLRLVGLSLGGVLARELARERPYLVERIVTIGSPIVGGPKYTAVAHRFRRRGVDMEAIQRKVEARNRTPIRSPMTAIYSKRDAVVAWPACIDRHHDHVEHIEVQASHLGLAVHPDVFRILGARLAKDI